MDKTNLRAVDTLIKEVEVIEVACVGSQRNQSREESKLDEFQKYKMDLNAVLTKIKRNIKTKQTIEDRIGTNTESIKLKKEISNQFEEAKRLQTKMESVYNDQRREFDNNIDTEISGEELESRQELMELMKQDLEYTYSSFNPSESTLITGSRVGRAGHGFNLAERAYNKRRKNKRNKGVVIGDLIKENEAQPLSMKQQQFIQESIERDAVLYEKLNEIHAGVKLLGVMGNDMIEEIEMQTVMLDEMDEKMGDLTERLETKNDEIKKLLDNNGGAVRWCPVLILCVILLACIGYIWNAFIA